MITRSTLTSTLMAAALFAGCTRDNGTESQPDRAKARFDIQAFTQTHALAKASSGTTGLVMKDTAGIHFTVTEARVFVDKVKLIGSDDSCEKSKPVVVLAKEPAEVEDDSSGHHEDEDCDDTKNTLKGPFVVDLLTGATTPSVGDLEVAAGSYHKVKLHLGHAKKSDGIVDTSDPLFGKTLYVKGTFAAAGQEPQPFTLGLKFDEEVEMEDLAGMHLDAATLNTILVSLRMDGWLANLDVGECLNHPEVVASLHQGVNIVENSEIGRCLDIEKTIKENIRNSFEVEDDDDHDGKREHDHDEHEDEPSKRDSI